MSVNDQIALLIALATLLGIIAGWWRYLRPRIRRAHDVAEAVRELLLGRDAEVDAITGHERQPAHLGVGERLETVETLLHELTGSVHNLADVQGRLADHESRISSLERRIDGLAFRAIEARADLPGIDETPS